MKIKLTLAFLTFSLLVNAQSFQEKVTSVSNVKLAVTNVGTFGNAFRGYRDGSSNTSCEYPAGSGVEHLFESGIWIGGINSGNQIRVSTAAVDATQGYVTGGSGFEFTTEVGAELKERSSFRDSPFFTPEAVSHQDYVSNFTDKNNIVPGTQINIRDHIPMFVDVELRTYNFNFAFSDFVVFVDMDIVNIGNPNGIDNTYNDVYFGLWANTVVRNVNITPTGSGGAAFYNKGGNGFNDSLHMAFCYDHSGDVGFTNSYIAQKFLGATDKFGFHHPDTDTNFQSNYNAWQFNSPGTGTFQQPSGDNEQYLRLANGLEDQDCWTTTVNCGAAGSFQDQLNLAGNRSDLVSVGPFQDFKEGDTIKVSFAFVLAPKLDDGNNYTDNTPAQQAQLYANVNRAQTAFNGEDVNFNGILDEGEDGDRNGKITRFILPSPPDIPNTKVIAENRQISVYWTDNAEASIDPISKTEDFEGYRIYLTKLGFDVTGVPNLLRDLTPIAEYDIKGNNIANEIGLDPVKLKNPVIINDDNLVIDLDSAMAYGIDRFSFKDTNLYTYSYKINNVLNGWQYAVGVSAFDTGDEDQNLEPLESSLLANNFRVFPGKVSLSGEINQEVYAYPNPYYLGASWEGKSNFQEQSRKLIFANLPQRCMIRIFTPAGDLIDEISHDENYKGEDIRWFETFGSDDKEKNVFSGGEHAWDLLSSFTQIISRGIYIFAVEDLDTGEIKKGKFTIIK